MCTYGAICEYVTMQVAILRLGTVKEGVRGFNSFGPISYLTDVIFCLYTCVVLRSCLEIDPTRQQYIYLALTFLQEIIEIHVSR